MDAHHTAMVFKHLFYESILRIYDEPKIDFQNN